ncbi:hypothetical protein, partial [Escherichia coli]|uniref:hypothetical protein n=1 Tax=Escherichia coli TaxID=562 RepID=UPI002117C15C
VVVRLSGSLFFHHCTGSIGILFNGAVAAVSVDDFHAVFINRHFCLNAFLWFYFSPAGRTQSNRSGDCLSAHFVIFRAFCQLSFYTTCDALKCDF